MKEFSKSVSSWRIYGQENSATFVSTHGAKWPFLFCLLVVTSEGNIRRTKKINGISACTILFTKVKYFLSSKYSAAFDTFERSFFVFFTNACIVTVAVRFAHLHQ